MFTRANMKLCDMVRVYDRQRTNGVDRSGSSDGLVLAMI